MKRQQSIAYRSPCFEAEETAAPEFGWRLPAPLDHVTLRLTANIGLE